MLFSLHPHHFMFFWNNISYWFVDEPSSSPVALGSPAPTVGARLIPLTFKNTINLNTVFINILNEWMNTYECCYHLWGDEYLVPIGPVDPSVIVLLLASSNVMMFSFVPGAVALGSYTVLPGKKQSVDALYLWMCFSWFSLCLTHSLLTQLRLLCSSINYYISVTAQCPVWLIQLWPLDDRMGLLKFLHLCCGCVFEELRILFISPELQWLQCCGFPCV